MKKLLALLAVCFALTGYSQTTTSQSILDTFKPVLSATNIEVVPYLTYAPSAPTKYGGGVLAIYNLNNYVGAGAGVDWLGHFSLFSGNVTLKYDIVPFKNSSSAYLQGITITPFAIGGLATAIGGAGDNNGGISTIEGGGLSLSGVIPKAPKLKVGGAVVNWTGAGDYSGKHYEGFLSFKFW